MIRTRYTIATAVLVIGCASQSAKSPESAPAPATPASPPAEAARPPVTETGGARSTLTGVYTAAQATAGKDVYLGRCLSCHAGEHGTGVFRRKWAGKPVKELWSVIRETMPDDDPGGLSDEAYSSIVAYLLQLNGLPAGATPLPADSLALKTIRLDTLTKR
jgi:mono/diheme cytochrome c family protein